MSTRRSELSLLNRPPRTQRAAFLGGAVALALLFGAFAVSAEGPAPAAVAPAPAAPAAVAPAPVAPAAVAPAAVAPAAVAPVPAAAAPVPAAVAPATHREQHSNEGWEFLAAKDNIHVWKREIAGQGMPGFRGQGYIKANIDTILRVMLDVSRHTKWMYGCEESVTLKEIGLEHAIMYNRVSAPWPVWDRDVIADTQIVRFPEQRAATVHFKNLDSKLRPVPDRVIRLPLLVGFYKLWEVEPKKTKVLYQVEADLGGSVPRWLAIQGAKTMPYATLYKLREEVESRH